MKRRTFFGGLASAFAALVVAVSSILATTPAPAAPMQQVLLAYGAQGSFTPASLFTGGVQGVWYDPSDFGSMFQDAAGTTPVTAVEQPVGLLKDKSGNGHDATQATSANRPTLSARVNLLTKTEQFDDAAWTKGAATVTANATTDPLGGSTADKLIADNTSAMHYVDQTASVPSGYVFSVYAKAGEYNRLILGDSPGQYYVGFNLTSGTVESSVPVTGISAASISSAGNGWYRCSITFSAAMSYVSIYPFNAAYTNGALNPVFTGDNASGIYIWGADVRSANPGNVPAYQRVNTSTDYDTTGFPYYLAFNGTNSALATGSINLTATNKATLFAGVRKASGNGFQTLVELGTGAVENGFSIFAPSSSNNDYDFRLASNANATAGTYTPPVTDVLSVAYDFSQSPLPNAGKARINGAAVTTSGTAAVSGSFINGALNIGARSGGSLFFNGSMYSLIVRGAASTNTEVTNTETWVNSKTGAY